MFKIGEFSTIARVSDVLLRYYDEIDLFKPAYVDPMSGYRHYLIQQLPELNRILALRDLGFSLEQVKQLVSDDITIAEMQGMLKLKKAQIEQAVSEEQARLRRVKSRLKQIQQHETQAQHEVVLKSIPEHYFLSIREPVPFIRKSGWLYYQVNDAVQANKVPGLSYCMAIFHEPAFREKNVDFELGFLIHEDSVRSVSLPGDRRLTVKQLGRIDQALTCVHRGPWSEIHLGFGVIGSWIEENEMRISGRPRELYLNLVPPEHDEDLIVEIQIPVNTQNE